MLVEIEFTKKDKATVESTFPVYVTYGDTFDSGGGYECYARIDESMTDYVVTERSDGEWEYKSDRADRRMIGKIFAPKFYAGDFSGYHYKKILPEEFYAKVDEMSAALSAIPR